jgi:hypothetical protein
VIKKIKMKNLLLMAAVAFMFTACNKCVECTTIGSNGSTHQVTTYEYNENTGQETITEYGDRITEICSDNFESKKDFNDYIDHMEAEYDAECKSDFWN